MWEMDELNLEFLIVLRSEATRSLRIGGRFNFLNLLLEHLMPTWTEQWEGMLSWRLPATPWQALQRGVQEPVQTAHYGQSRKDRNEDWARSTQQGDTAQPPCMRWCGLQRGPQHPGNYNTTKMLLLCRGGSYWWQYSLAWCLMPRNTLSVER